MQNVTNDFTPKDMAQMLDLNSETLRKYALALENAGYLFSKTSGGHRKYYQQDVAALTQFKSLLNQNGMTLELAAQIVVAKHLSPSQTITTDVTVAKNTEIERFDERYTELMAKMDLLDQVPVLLKKLQDAEQRDQEKTRKIEELQVLAAQHGQQLQRIENSVSQFGVADIAKELHRMQKEAAAADAVVKVASAESKKGFWSRLFGK